VRVDVRVIAATNRDLEAMVKDGRFREDLYYRLNIIPMTIPPLRNRRSDLPPLIDYFIGKHSQEAHRVIRGLTPSARNVMMNYAWPGNVRQVESAIERAILLCEGDTIDVEDLPVEIRQEASGAGTFTFRLPPEGISFDEVEKSLITQAMEQTNWNITRAAKLLGLSFRTLQYRLEKFGLKRPGKGNDE
jgi:transcriptional regulator with PAS, ATPase and Fis domain